MKASESYNPKACCGDDCRLHDDQDEYGQCWGDVEVVDEETVGEFDWYWVHSCQGHMEMWKNYDVKNYIPEVKNV